VNIEAIFTSLNSVTKCLRNLNKAGNVHINVRLRRFREAIIAAEKQKQKQKQK
jgi:hypothetical protein